jgi:UDP-GlcNAc:undecaprenyl-phosphate GlcNAc-1-phosphate transferase
VALAIGAVAMAMVGLIDDLRRLSPQTKLFAQIVLAAGMLQFADGLQVTRWKLLNVGITLFWIIAITNAFNLLDNMDGLSATIALVAAAFRLLFFVSEDNLAGARVTAIFVGAIGGFLVRNFARPDLQREMRKPVPRFLPVVHLWTASTRTLPA